MAVEEVLEEAIDDCRWVELTIDSPSGAPPWRMRVYPKFLTAFGLLDYEDNNGDAGDIYTEFISHVELL